MGAQTPHAASTFSSHIYLLLFDLTKTRYPAKAHKNLPSRLHVIGNVLTNKNGSRGQRSRNVKRHQNLELFLMRTIICISVKLYHV